MIQIDKLLKIDLSDLSTYILNSEHKDYFLRDPGMEHYKLLGYFSNLSSNETFLDIGTNRGLSALALSINPTNKIFSFDLENYRQISYVPENVEFILDWITMPKYKQIVLDSSFIFLDTLHDGVFEHQFYHYLRSIGWKGILMLDDIKLNIPMKEFWNVIEERKIDVSEFGHITGTGLVIFE